MASPEAGGHESWFRHIGGLMNELGSYAVAAAGFWWKVPTESSHLDPVNHTLHLNPETTEEISVAPPDSAFDDLDAYFAWLGTGSAEPDEFDELVGLGPAPGSVLYEEESELDSSDHATPTPTPDAKPQLIDADASAIEESFAPMNVFDVAEFSRRLQGRLGDRMLRELLKVEADGLLAEEWGQLRCSE